MFLFLEIEGIFHIFLRIICINFNLNLKNPFTKMLLHLKLKLEHTRSLEGPIQSLVDQPPKSLNVSV